MPSFRYVARDPSGARLEGVLDSADDQALAEALAGLGLVLVEAAETQASNPATVHRWFTPKIAADDLLLFCRQISTLLRAGVPILRALRGLQESATNVRFGEVLGRLQEQLEGGRELSGAMQRENGLFSEYMISMVRVGEVTGRLPEIFQGLFVQLSFDRESREQVRSALRYPIFVICTALAALIAVNIFVIPSFAKVYSGLHAELPWITRLLIFTSNLLVHHSLLLLGVALAAALALVAALRTPEGQRFRDGLLLRLPIFGTLVHKAALARFNKSFGLALNAGVPLVDALQVALATTDNVVLSERIAGMRQAAERGESLVRAARATGVFTPTILQMIGVGEETGALGDMLVEIADLYQKDVEYALRGLAAQIEPVLILILGAMVLVIALGVFLPMWDLSRVVLNHG